jgi:hypothetical protein
MRSYSAVLCLLALTLVTACDAAGGEPAPTPRATVTPATAQKPWTPAPNYPNAHATWQANASRMPVATPTPTVTPQPTATPQIINIPVQPVERPVYVPQPRREPTPFPTPYRYEPPTRGLIDRYYERQRLGCGVYIDPCP